MRLRFVPRRPWRALAAAATVVAVPILIPPAASAGEEKADATEHCVQDAIDQKASGEYVMSAMRCYETYREVLESEGIDVPRVTADTPEALAQEAHLLSNITVGIHYDGANLTPPTYTAVLPSCGGWLNLPTSPVNWRNKISSTWNVCATIDHFTGLGLVGTSFTTTTTGIWNLNATLDNNAESVRYN